MIVILDRNTKHAITPIMFFMKNRVILFKEINILSYGANLFIYALFILIAFIDFI